MKNVNLESQTDKSVRTQLKSARTSTPKRASEGRRQTNEWDSHRASAVSRSHRPAATQESPDAVAQQLQIYVSAIECGAMSHALAVESQLRAFLASGR